METKKIGVAYVGKENFEIFSTDIIEGKKINGEKVDKIIYYET